MKHYYHPKLIILLSLIGIIFLGALFRLYGLNWDENQHLHPDERFLTMVIMDMEWPNNIYEYINPNLSSLNPYNVGHPFFVYGTFPLILVKYISSFLALDTSIYNNIALVGRLLSAIFDIFTLILVFLIGRIFSNYRLGLLSSFFYTLMVLPIQLSHFFTVDTFLVFFLTASFYLLIKVVKNEGLLPYSILLGTSYGLALACKISALIMLPVIFIGYILYVIKYEKVKKSILAISLLLSTAYIITRLSDPHLFSSDNLLSISLNNNFIENIKQLSYYSSPNSNFPPSVQWLSKNNIIFPFNNLLIWGVGIPIGLLAILGILDLIRMLYISGKTFIKNKVFSIKKISSDSAIKLIIILWIFLLFGYQGIQFAKAMRYFYPIYPFLAIITGNILYKKIKSRFQLLIIILVVLIYPLSFISIYSRPHSRIQASEWIYNNIPSKSVISCEYWDDCLPLSIYGNNSEIYKTETLHLYDRDTSAKWEVINKQLENIDYLILSSNRLWGSIPKVPEKYPIASKFYDDLFNEKLDFIKVAEFVSRPTIPLTSLELIDDIADESFTVYDHPMVLIFQKVY